MQTKKKNYLSIVAQQLNFLLENDAFLTHTKSNSAKAFISEIQFSIKNERW